MKTILAVFEIIFICLTVCDIKVQGCNSSPTTASGTHAPSRICSGDLIFEDNFDSLDTGKWKRQSTVGGGGNWEFQWYCPHPENSAASDGVLKIKPTLTADYLGEAALTSVTLDLNNRGPEETCTNDAFKGCSRTGTPDNILNPIKSARLDTVDSFSFKYGRVEIRAKLPAGDWLWPAIWMLPHDNRYGGWPTSGEIDIMESRGNRDLIKNGVNIGEQQMGSTLHWGPNPGQNAWSRTHWDRQEPHGFSNGFHTYEVLWTPDSLTFKVDGQNVGQVAPPAGGFWELGQFSGNNPWSGQSKMAPFDQEFYIILNLAVGGTNWYFPDDAENPHKKPWANSSPKAPKDFWDKKNDWLPTWNLGTNEDSHLKVDYVRVYAL